VLVATAPAWAVWPASGWALVVATRSLIGMIRALRRGTWGIDILAVTAIVSTVALGDYWAALVVVLMLTGGEALEDYAAQRARRELGALLDRAPRLAHREAGDQIIDVPVAEISVDDVVEVRPGEVVPVDGQLLDAEATLDESSLTGESLPVAKTAGDAVASGTVNSGGVIRVRATAIAADSQYQAIIDLVRAASDSRAPFVRLADRVALPFTAVAFLIGGIGWAVSGDPTRFAEVLVVATPCPLLIAAPVAFIAGMSRAAGFGVIIKNGGVLERLARVRTAAFDKTGTLTRGEPVVVRVDVVGTVDADHVLTAAAGVEQDSAHVLAQAVVTAAGPSPAATGVAEVMGRGIRGTVDGVEIAVGRLDWVDAAAQPSWVPLAAGEMAIHVAIDGVLAGRIVLTDALRPESPDAIVRLRTLGVQRTVMLSGDAPETAEAIAARCGIDDVRARLLPADKVAAVRDLQPRPVLMVGDGINDAPVLALADVGIAMGARGATAASESADVVVLVEDLLRVPRTVALAQRTIRIALQSIGIGIGLSLILMVIAAFGVIPAIVGAGLQEVIDVVTILNSLRAGRRRE
jgi:heavy metal translocating P-type ATPase